MADDAVCSEPFSAPNSLIFRENTGNFSDSGRLLVDFAAENTLSALWFFSEFPTQRNRELFWRNREFSRPNREFDSESREGVRGGVIAQT